MVSLGMTVKMVCMRRWTTPPTYKVIHPAPGSDIWAGTGKTDSDVQIINNFDTLLFNGDQPPQPLMNEVNKEETTVNTDDNYAPTKTN